MTDATLVACNAQQSQSAGWWLGASPTDWQPLDADLTALAGIGTTGFIKRTGSATFATLSAGASAYTADAEDSAYTGQDKDQAGSVYAKLADLNQLRVAYEALRAGFETLRTRLITAGLVSA